MNRLTVLALALSGASASFFTKRQDPQNLDFGDDASEHLAEMCQPLATTGEYDATYPCNAMAALQYQCMYGPDGGDFIMNHFGRGSNPLMLEESPKLETNDFQRACICQSEARDLLAGCMACMKAHGGVKDVDYVEPEDTEPIFKKYCDAKATPTEGYFDVVASIFPGDADFSRPSSSSSESKTYTDPLGNATAVSLYYTPAVTNTAAYVPTVPSPESSGANASYTSVYTSDGQIMPTAGLKEAETSGSSTESAGSGAMATGFANPGAAVGMLGLAALVAAL